jgi:TonB-dependent starch-binding outer membrane protein SusC
MTLRVRRSSLGIGLAAALLWAGPLWAQAPGIIEGRVTFGRTTQPLSAVQVSLPAHQLGVLTTAEGRYRIAGVPAGTQTIIFQRIGFSSVTQTVEVRSGEVTTLDAALDQRVLDLDAIVVTGQGSEISRRRLSTNIDVVTQEQIQASPATRLDQLLQTALPSVQVRLASGQPGATSVTRGRGPVSVSRSTTPVIYVDGVRVDNLNTQAELSLNTSGNRRQGTQTSAIADIPLENIERIEYVPGGAATTLYGSDAANGVIQIFTSKGVPGQARFTIESEVGVESANPEFFFFDETVDLLYKNGLRQQHRLSGNGGTEDVTWSFSGSLTDREGFRIGNNASTSYQLRTGLAAQMRPNFQYTNSFAYSYNEYERTRDGNAGGYAPLWLLEAGRIFALGWNNRLYDLSPSEFSDLRTFLQKAEDLQNYGVSVNRFQTSHSLRWEARDNLSFNTTFGLDQRTSNETGIVTNEFLVHTRVRPAGTDDRGSISSYDRKFLGVTMEAGGQHRFERDWLSVVTSGGGQLFRNDDQQIARTADNVRDGSLTVRGAGVTSADDFRLTVVNYGTYAQQNWGFFDRYFLDFGLRADGNTAFGDEVGVQYYPKVGFAYDLSAEGFFRDRISESFISSLRLRGNYGVAGNFPPPFARDRTVSFNSYQGQQSAGFGQPGNAELGPEKTTTLEAGFDAEALDGRLSVQFNWYDATTRDALFSVPSPPSTGETTQFKNVGVISNHGVEFRVSAEVLRTQNYTARLTGSFNTMNNVVEDAGGSPTFGLSGFSSSTVESVVQEGWPVGALRGSVGTLGPDGTITNVELLQYLGKPLPDQFGSLGLEVTAGASLRFNVDADWQRGAQLHSFDRQFRYLYNIPDPILPQSVQDRYAANQRSNWLNLTNFFVEDTDYLLIRNVSASYILPQSLVGGFSRGVDLTLQMQNPYGWWTSSFNPETDHSGAATQGGATVGGFNYGSDPAPRTLLASVRVRF